MWLNSFIPGNLSLPMPSMITSSNSLLGPYTAYNECTQFAENWSKLCDLKLAKDPLLGFGMVLPPWFLLQWLRALHKTTTSTASDEDRSILARIIPTYDTPLDLRTNSEVLPARKFVPRAVVTKSFETSDTETMSSCGSNVDVIASGKISLGNPMNPLEQGTWTTSTCSRRSSSSEKCPILLEKLAAPQTQPKRLYTGLRRARRVTQLAGSTTQTTGLGKQPVTRCHQCKVLFPTLMELNAHFMVEHAFVLRTELEHTKSWKSHAVETMCFLVRH
ncbi:unnamed protein product [Echinostoma caproni]|uniref:C2H2-type domain-containing protein n=1 Tax=Echinostoma caproni TaxID=27848 RepID=A0A183BA62_9TREM|nr:unnamed protein product [Echinostoma caproni]